MPRNISPTQLKDLIQRKAAVQVIDVRDRDEFFLPEGLTAGNIPLTELAEEFSNLGLDDVIVFICQTGKRSQQAASFASTLGFSKASSLSGGINGWNSCE